jgi:hypothetical protein
MSTDRETTRIVRSWLDQGVTVLPDRVLDAVLDQLPATPQRRRFWSARRSTSMNLSAKLAAAAAAFVVVAVVGYQLLPGRGPGSGATLAPSPTALPLIARGTFNAKGADVELDAIGGASDVTGRMVATMEGSGFTVDLECARNTDAGYLWIGGDVTASTFTEYAPEGTRAAIVFKRGSPVQAVFMFQMNDPRSASCQAFFDDMIGNAGGYESRLPVEPIDGTVELGP